MNIRPYISSDKDACMAVFHSNRPKFFTEDETQEFSQFLDKLPCPYFVMKAGDAEIVGCGGYFHNMEQTRGGLAWGMVLQAYHGQGLGKKLTLFRLVKLIEVAPRAELRIDTSHHTEAFYAKFGFVTVNITPHGYGLGLHKHDMIVQLNETIVEQIRTAYNEL